MDFLILNLDNSPVSGDQHDALKPRLSRILGERLPLHFGGHDAWEEWLKSIKIEFSSIWLHVRLPRRTLTGFRSIPS